MVYGDMPCRLHPPPRRHGHLLARRPGDADRAVPARAWCPASRRDAHVALRRSPAARSPARQRRPASPAQWIVGRDPRARPAASPVAIVDGPVDLRRRPGTPLMPIVGADARAGDVRTDAMPTSTSRTTSTAAAAPRPRTDDHIRDLIEQVLFTVARRARDAARTSAAGLLALVFEPNSTDARGHHAVSGAERRCSSTCPASDRGATRSRSRTIDAALQVDGPLHRAGRRQRAAGRPSRCREAAMRYSLLRPSAGSKSSSGARHRSTASSSSRCATTRARPARCASARCSCACCGPAVRAHARQRA